MRTFIRVLVGAFALWLTTLIVGGNGLHGVWIDPIGATEIAAGADQVGIDGSRLSDINGFGQVVTLVLVALVFGLVNSTLGRVVRTVSIPLYILTLGLFFLVVNGILFAVVAWLSDLVGFGLRLDGFWWGVLGATVMSFISGILNGLLGTGKNSKK